MILFCINNHLWADGHQEPQTLSQYHGRAYIEWEAGTPYTNFKVKNKYIHIYIYHSCDIPNLFWKGVCILLKFRRADQSRCRSSSLLGSNSSPLYTCMKQVSRDEINNLHPIACNDDQKNIMGTWHSWYEIWIVCPNKRKRGGLQRY